MTAANRPAPPVEPGTCPAKLDLGEVIIRCTRTDEHDMHGNQRFTRRWTDDKAGTYEVAYTVRDLVDLINRQHAELAQLRERDATFIAGWNARSQLISHDRVVAESPDQCPPCAAYWAADWREATDEMRCADAQEWLRVQNPAHNLAVAELVDEWVDD